MNGNRSIVITILLFFGGLDYLYMNGLLYPFFGLPNPNFYFWIFAIQMISVGVYLYRWELREALYDLDYMLGDWVYRHEKGFQKAKVLFGKFGLQTMLVIYFGLTIYEYFFTLPQRGGWFAFGIVLVCTIGIAAQCAIAKLRPKQKLGLKAK